MLKMCSYANPHTYAQLYTQAKTYIPWHSNSHVNS